MSDEVYHLQVQGEQRGPYTLRQIDHQLNSGLIREDSLVVREGMADWAPVTNLVKLRRRRKRWKFRGVLIAFVCFILVIARFLAPVVADGWREASQVEFTKKAAYWRARDCVRHQAVPPRGLVRFGHLDSARVVLDPLVPGAQVHLIGDLTLEGGQRRPAAWQVTLAFDPETRQWTGTSVEEEGR